MFATADDSERLKRIERRVREQDQKLDEILKRLDLPSEGDGEIPVEPPPLPRPEPTPVEQADSETSESMGGLAPGQRLFFW